MGIIHKRRRAVEGKNITPDSESAALLEPEKWSKEAEYAA